MTVLTISTTPTIAQTTTSILTRSTRISTDGIQQHSHKYTSHTQYHKGWKTCTPLMTAGLSKAILPICKPTSRIHIRESKQPILHYFMHCTNSKYSEKERIGAIDQGFTCLAAQTAQNLALEDLEDYPMLA